MSTDYSTSHDSVQSVDYEDVPDTKVPLTGTSPQLPYPPLHFHYSQRPHPPQLSPSHDENQPSYHSSFPSVGFSFVYFFSPIFE